MCPLPQPGLAHAALQAYRLGQSLDALFAAHLNRVFGAIALNALEGYALPPGSSKIRPRLPCMGRMREKRAKSARARKRQRGQYHRGPPLGTARMGMMISSRCC
jgi:hypothetical protein